LLKKVIKNPNKRKVLDFIKLGVPSALGAVFNTVSVLGLVVLFNGGDVLNDGSVVNIDLILLIMSTNGVFELVSVFVFTPPIAAAMIKFKRANSSIPYINNAKKTDENGEKEGGAEPSDFREKGDAPRTDKGLWKALKGGAGGFGALVSGSEIFGNDRDDGTASSVSRDNDEFQPIGNAFEYGENGGEELSVSDNENGFRPIGEWGNGSVSGDEVFGNAFENGEEPSVLRDNDGFRPIGEWGNGSVSGYEVFGDAFEKGGELLVSENKNGFQPIGNAFEYEKKGGEPSVSGDKNRLRALAKERIGAMSEGERAAADKIIFERLTALNEVADAENIMLFNAKGHEPSMSRLLEYLVREGKTVFLPVIDGEEMTAVAVSENTEYEKNVYGIDEPIAEKNSGGKSVGKFWKDEEIGSFENEDNVDTGNGAKGGTENGGSGGKRGATPSDLDIVIVPLVAFDGEKNRIGRGKGYYDKFLSKTAAVKIGAAYKAAEVEKIDADRYDVKMDMIVTEK
jgi:5-formyltetrahydrofolate cyclo-ligase